MLEILKANVLIAYQQLEQYQLDRYGRGVVSAIDRNRDMVVIKTAQQSVLVSLKDDNWERGLDAETTPRSSTTSPRAAQTSSPPAPAGRAMWPSSTRSPSLSAAATSRSG